MIIKQKCLITTIALKQYLWYCLFVKNKQYTVAAEKKTKQLQTECRIGVEILKRLREFCEYNPM